MTNWKKYKLGDVAKVQTGPFGSQLHAKDYTLIGTPIITVEHLGENLIIHSNLPLVSDVDKDRLRKYEIYEGDIVFSRVGSVDRRAYVSQKENGWLFSGRCLRVRVTSQEIFSKYLSYYFGLDSFKEYIRQIAVGATMPSLNTNILSEIEFPAPDIATQQKIAEILTSLDDKIELNHRMNQTLEQMAQTLYQQYFVNDIDKDNLPEGWKYGKLGNLLKFRNGKSSPSRDNSGKYAVYGSNGIIGNADISNVNEKCMVIGRVGSFCGSVYFTLEKAYVTDNAIIAEPSIEESSVFCYILIRNLNLNNYRGGSGQPLINQTVLSNIDVIIPTNSKIGEFEKTAISIYNKIKKNEKESELLASIRDSLLPKLLSGEIDVIQTKAEELYEPVLS